MGTLTHCAAAGAPITNSRAAAAIETGKRFAASVRKAISEPSFSHFWRWRPRKMNELAIALRQIAAKLPDPTKIRGNVRCLFLIFDLCANHMPAAVKCQARGTQKSADRLVFHAQAKTGANLKFLVYLVPLDGQMVRLTFFTLEPLFADALPTFEKIATSYKPLPSQ